MSEKNNSDNREEVPLERIVLSNMYSLEAVKPKTETLT